MPATRARWRRCALAVAAATAVSGCAAGAASVRVTAATAPLATERPIPAPVAAARPPAGSGIRAVPGPTSPDPPSASGRSFPDRPPSAPVAPRPPVPVLDDPTILPVVPVGVAPPTSPRPAACGGYANPRQITPGVVPGPGSATVSWQADGHTEVVGYRVQAISQRLVTGAQPAPVQRTVAQPADCVPVSVTVTGLAPGDPYVFWLEEEVRDVGGTSRFIQVGTSGGVIIGR